MPGRKAHIPAINYSFIEYTIGGDMERTLWPSCGFVPTVQIALLQASAGRAFQCIDGGTKLTDCKYLLSLYESTTTANYGAPRNLTASVTWKY